MGGFKTARATPAVTRPATPNHVDPHDATTPSTSEGTFTGDTTAGENENIGNTLPHILDLSGELLRSVPEAAPAHPTDFIHRVKGMYRLLHLESDKGIGGAGEY